MGTTTLRKRLSAGRNPGFNETFHGFRSFNSMLEAAARLGLVRLERDDKSGGYIVRMPANE